MNTKISNLKHLRVYRHLSHLQLLNHLLCNRVIKSSLLVSAAPALYRYLCYFPGKTITNFLVGSTFNRLFTLGSSLEQLHRNSKHLSERSIPLIIDFCVEGRIEDPKSQQQLDEHAKQFARSASWAAKNHDFLFSIKISALLDMNLLLKYNKAVQLRDRLWIASCEEGRFRAQKLFEKLKGIYRGLSEQDFEEYLREIHGYQGQAKEFDIDETQFKMNHQPYYLYHPSKNQLLLIKILLPLDTQEQTKILAFLRRLNQILQPEFKNPNDLRVLVDAEQSYIQRAVQSLSEQLQSKYNQQRAYIIPTLQNYLKTANKRVQYELESARRRNLWFGMKLVRGAYLVEETRYAQANQSELPIVGSFEDTTHNYLGNFAKIVHSGVRGEVFLAGHNEQTISALLSILDSSQPTLRVNFAQLLGLGDHLTFLLKQQRQSVYKLVPWASTERMVPYLIRRSEELSQMRYPLDTQAALLRHELLYRLFPL